jgi:hypothetical protein
VNGAKGASALARNTLKNLERWRAAVARLAPASRLRPPLPAIAATIPTLLVVVASMFLFDAAATNCALDLPQWFRNVFEKITNFGRSGWLLVPFGFILSLC